MFFIRNFFVVSIDNLTKEGSVLDFNSKEVLVKIKNDSKDWGSRFLSFLTFNFMGKMKWSFLLDNQEFFMVYKETFDNNVYFKYKFNHEFYNLYKIDISNSFLPFINKIFIKNLRNKTEFICRKRNFLIYEVFDRDNVLYCSMGKSGFLKQEYFVKVDRFLESVDNYLFLGLPLVISVFY